MSRFMIMTAALGTMALAAFVACADSDTGARPGPSIPDEGGTLPDVDSGDGKSDAGTDADAAVDAAPRECSTEGYCRTTLPSGQVLQGVWSDGAGVTWAVSEQGRILRYDGTTWSLHAGVDGALWAIWGSSPTDIWIGGDNGLFHGEGTSSATLVFNPVKAPGPVTPIMSIWGSAANDVWAVGNVYSSPIESRVLHYTTVPSKDPNAPKVVAWTEEAVPQSEVLWYRVTGSATSGVWVTGEYFAGRRLVYLAHRKPGATDFEKIELPRDPATPSPSGDLKQIYDAKLSSDGTSLWVLGITYDNNKPIYAAATTPDGWNTYAWTYGISSGAPDDRDDPENKAIFAVSMDNAFIAGDYARLRHWNGAKWKQAVTAVDKLPLVQPFYAIGGLADDLWFVGDNIAIHRIPSKIEAE
jgi:hypothetical protein